MVDALKKLANDPQIREWTSRPEIPKPPSQPSLIGMTPKQIDRKLEEITGIPPAPIKAPSPPLPVAADESWLQALGWTAAIIGGTVVGAFLLGVAMVVCGLTVRELWGPARTLVDHFLG